MSPPHNASLSRSSNPCCHASTCSLLDTKAPAASTQVCLYSCTQVHGPSSPLRSSSQSFITRLLLLLHVSLVYLGTHATARSTVHGRAGSPIIPKAFLPPSRSAILSSNGTVQVMVPGISGPDDVSSSPSSSSSSGLALTSSNI